MYIIASFDFITAFSESSAGVLCNIRHPSETDIKLKSREISFVHNLLFNCPVVLKFCTSHDSDAAVLCTNFQTGWSNEGYVIGKQNCDIWASGAFRKDIPYFTRPLRYRGYYNIWYPLDTDDNRWGPVGPNWAPCWPHEPCYQGCYKEIVRFAIKISWCASVAYYSVTAPKLQCLFCYGNKKALKRSAERQLFMSGWNVYTGMEKGIKSVHFTYKIRI